MTKPRDPEALLSAYLVDGMEVLPDRVVDSVLDEVHRTRQQVVFGPWRTRSTFRPALGAAALVVVLVLGGGFFVIQRGLPAVAGPSPTPSANPSPSQPAVVAPNATPTATPSPTPTPIVWTEASLKEDWPAPVRAEPVGGASVQPMPLTHIDPTDDTGSDVLPWVDIRSVMGDTSAVHLNLVSNQPPVVDPAEQWIAYGVVVDEDRDGVPDTRYGIDNMPVDAEGERPHRVWRTDLHTGRTDDQGFRNEGYPSGAPLYRSGSDADFSFGGTADVAGQGMVEWGIELDMPFYTWASVIVDGRVVATDYAPDAGWLVATPGAKPGGTYLLENPFPLRLSMTVSDGWTVVREQRFYHAGSLTRDDGRTGLRFVMVDTLAEDACAKRAGAIDGRATVDDLVAFLAGLKLIDISENTDVMLDGHRGKYLAFTRTAGEIDCGWGGMDGWPASSPSASDEVDRVWILDVDGTPLVIDAFSSPEASDAVRAELQQTVESIQIEPLPRTLAAPPSPTPVPTATPVPTPVPTPFAPQAGPVPAGARSWEVTVANKSSDPATLLMAEEGENGIGQLCGSVTPNVVPAGVTQKVTFLLPPKRVTDCWIWVNPIPGEGGSFFQTSDAPMKGGFLITADGQTMWGGQ